MKTSLVLLALALAVPLVSQAQTKGNAEAAKGKVSMCAGCHSIPMYKSVFPEVYNVPKIGGQPSEYIVKALQAYKSGERSHPTMRGIARALSDQDMADIAALYGKAK